MSRLKVVGYNIRKMREAQHLTQDQLAKKSGLNRSHISHVEKGIRNISLVMLFKIADGIRCDPANLLNIQSRHIEPCDGVRPCDCGYEAVRRLLNE